MSTAVAPASCTCGLEIREEIWRCPHHVYRKGKRTYVSVSKVIKTVFPTDYSAVDPIVLECARLRGEFVDTYFSEYLNDPNSVVLPDDVPAIVVTMFPRDPQKHAEDCRERILRLLDWWHASGLKATHVQHTVFSDEDGVAGTFDLGTTEHIIDLKNVSQLQANYVLQLGAYINYDPETGRRPAILHVTKEKIRLVPYQAKECHSSWNACVNWFNAMQTLK